MLWGVGTWSLKGAFYSNLRKEGRAAGKGADPPGYCHFGEWMDEEYFKQITSEYLGYEATKTKGGKAKAKGLQKWIPRIGYENHLLDCEVYGDALGDYLGVNRMTPDEWRQLQSLRGVPEDVVNADLFAPAPLVVQTQNHVRQAVEEPAITPPPPENTQITSARRGWLSRNR
jgi:phage terminase large subunit GpA-like protein